MDNKQLLKDYFIIRSDQIGCWVDSKGHHSIPVNSDIDRHIKEHIDGNRRIGGYCLTKDSNVKWAVFDIDNHGDGKLTMEQRRKFLTSFRSLSQNVELPFYIEASKGDGIHLWIFFKTFVPARSVRSFLKKYISYVGEKADLSIDLIKKIEVYPKQDSLDEDTPFGNYVYLPFFGGKDKAGGGINNGQTVFVDESCNTIEIKEFKTVDVSQLDKISDFLKLGEFAPTLENDKSFTMPEDVQVGSRHQKLLQRGIRLANKDFTINEIKWDLQNYNKELPNPKEEKELLDIVGWIEKKILSKRKDTLQVEPVIQLVSWEELYEDESKEPPDIIGKGVLKRKTTGGIVGPPKRYKTIIGLNLTDSLANREDFHGLPIEQNFRVGYFQAEISKYPLLHRIRNISNGSEFKSTNTNNIFLTTRCNIRITDPYHFDFLCTFIDAHKFDVLFFDPLVRFHNADENSNVEMDKVMLQFRELNELFNISTIIIHHSRKDESTGVLVRGASAIFGDLDTLITVTPDPHNKLAIKLNFDLRNAEAIDPMKLVLDPTTLWFQREPENKRDIANYIASTLSETQHIGMIRTELAAAVSDKFDITKRTANTQIKQLIDQGLINTDGKQRQMRLFGLGYRGKN